MHLRPSPSWLPIALFLLASACGGDDTKDAARGDASAGAAAGSGGTAATGGTLGGGQGGGGSGGVSVGGTGGGGARGGGGGTGGVPSDAGTRPDAEAPGPGSLDETFGSGGIAAPATLLAFGPNDAAIDAAGRIVIVGYQTNEGAPSQAALARFLPDGTLDTTFDSDGLWVSGVDDTFIHGVDFTADGDLVASGILGGPQPHSLWLLRLNEDGTPDPDFGTNGVVVQAMPESSYRSPDLRVDGTTLEVVGRVSTQKLVFSQHDLATGALSAGGDADAGSFETVDPAFTLAAHQFAASGNVLTATSSFTDGTIGIARFMGDGLIDLGFGSSGRADVPRPGDANSGFVRLAEGASVVVAGGSYSALVDGSSVSSPMVMRASSTGAVDTSFGDAGVWIHDAPGSVVRGLLPLSDGKLLVGVVQQTPPKGTVVRLDATGEPDATFADGGFWDPGYWPLFILPGPSATQAYVIGSLAGTSVARIRL